MKNLLLVASILISTTNVHAATSIAECNKFFEDSLWQQAIVSCTRAAEAGDSASQSILGEIYDQQGDSEMTLHWWRLAADSGYQPARNLLAMKHYYGGSVFGPEKGWVQDYGEAFSIWQQDAKQGVASSQFMVGVMYFKGEGVAADFSEAWAWLKLALENGYKLSTDVLIELSREITPEQKRLGMEKLALYRQS